MVLRISSNDDDSNLNKESAAAFTNELSEILIFEKGTMLVELDERT